jgi:hypothetical protein
MKGMMLPFGTKKDRKYKSMKGLKDRFSQEKICCKFFAFSPFKNNAHLFLPQICLLKKGEKIR